MNIAPIALAKIFSLTLLANLALPIPTHAALRSIIRPAIGLMFPCKAYPDAPEAAVIAIIMVEVPIAR